MVISLSPMKSQEPIASMAAVAPAMTAKESVADGRSPMNPFIIARKRWVYGSSRRASLIPAGRFSIDEKLRMKTLMIGAAIGAIGGALYAFLSGSGTALG